MAIELNRENILFQKSDHNQEVVVLDGWSLEGALPYYNDVILI